MSVDNAEELQAEAHIENLKSALAQEKSWEDSRGDFIRVLIWLVWHIDLAEKKNGNSNGKFNVLIALAKQSPLGLLAVALMFAVWVFAKMNGVLQ